VAEAVREGDPVGRFDHVGEVEAVKEADEPMDTVVVTVDEMVELTDALPEHVGVAVRVTLGLAVRLREGRGDISAPGST
jgi:hypothetical protein